MSRIIYPEIFSVQREGLRLIKLKHDADGASSVLIPFFTERGINLVTDTTAGNNANVHDVNQKLFYRQSENYVEQRNMLFEPVFSGTRAAIQYLKAFYSPNVRKLGDWGVSVTNHNKISYPVSFTDKVTLMGNIKAKHDSFPAGTSPLQSFLTAHSTDLNAVAAIVAAAVINEANQLSTRREAEEATQQRNNIWSPVVVHIHQTGEFLMKLFVGNQKRLGDWGFTVDDSPRPPKERISTVEPGGHITTRGIILGSTFTNTGTVELIVYKGSKVAGESTHVLPGEMMGITKGYSVITVVNTSSLKKGTFTTLAVY